MAAKMNKYQTAQPSTRTAFEKKFGEAEIYPIPYAVVSDLWNPDRIPAHLLPYLAWALRSSSSHCADLRALIAI